MYALLILDMQVGLFHGPEKPWHGEALLGTVNTLMSKARTAGAPVFLVRHVGPVGSPIEPGSPLTAFEPALAVEGQDIIIEKTRPNAFAHTDLASQLQARGVEGVVIVGMKTQYCVDSTCRAARDLGFEAVLIADGHTCADTPQFTAESIVAHHNATLAGAFCRVLPAHDWTF
ncbi:cysteine hydrolase [Pseudomonas sp. JQ170]|uniref:cysteine hydrolase family protein n=1 Tax=unclassified Pseudomonas TaxID=196821 RepID=UPI0026513AB0|nr:MULTISPECIES: cysteine hydrolase family protein [unclassified Pseudomonas]MDN7143405.1 cysteine hydrolase [Pseudomonas sp. JQ170]WRO78490.1 cysteine hydrolase family protein [Pseudomonas sp. 170C]